MNKFTVGIIIFLLLGVGALAIFSPYIFNNNKVDYSSYDTAKIISGDENNGNIADHVRGKADSSVVFLEYADFQCSGCANMAPKIDKIFEGYGDRVAFIYRNYPIDGHQNARAAAAAVESAGLQGYYWQMSEQMFSTQADWFYTYDTEKRTNYYANLFTKVSEGKGDVEQFKKDLNSSSIQKKIDFDKNLGKKRDSVDATPTIIINGEKVDFTNSNTDKKAEAIITEKLDEALKNAGLETGSKAEDKK